MVIPETVKETLARLQEAFPDDQTYEAYLFKKRWADGFICRKCGGCDYNRLMRSDFHLSMLPLPRTGIDYRPHRDASLKIGIDCMVLGRWPVCGPS